MTPVRFASVIVVFAAAVSVPVQAGEREQKARVKNEKKDVKNAEDKLKGDAKELSAAQQALRQAQAKENEGRHQLADARKRVGAEHKSSLGLDAALAEQTQAQQAFDDAKAPILKALKSKPEYQAAQDRVAAAKARSKTLHDESSLSEEARKKALAETSRDKLAVRELEQMAFTTEPKLKPLRDNLADAQEKVARLHAMLKDLVEADSAIKSGLRSLQNATRQTTQAKAEVAKESQELAGDQAKLAKEQTQLDKAKFDDKTHSGSSIQIAVPLPRKKK